MAEAAVEEPEDLSPWEWEHYSAIVEAMRLEWPDGTDSSGNRASPDRLPEGKYSGVSDIPEIRASTYRRGRWRRMWEEAQGAADTTAPVIEIESAGPDSPAQTSEAMYLDWLRTIREDGRIHGLATAAAITAIGARCHAATGSLTFPPRKIAADWGIGEKAVRETLKTLEAAGYVRRIDRGPGRVQHWQLTLPKAAASTADEQTPEGLRSAA